MQCNSVVCHILAYWNVFKQSKCCWHAIGDNKLHFCDLCHNIAYYNTLHILHYIASQYGIQLVSCVCFRQVPLRDLDNMVKYVIPRSCITVSCYVWTYCYMTVLRLDIYVSACYSMRCWTMLCDDIYVVWCYFLWKHKMFQTLFGSAWWFIALLCTTTVVSAGLQPKPTIVVCLSLLLYLTL